VFALDLGDLMTARQGFALAAELDRRAGDTLNLSIDLENQASLEAMAGRLLAARDAATAALKKARRTRDRHQTMVVHAGLAVTLGRLGRLPDARKHFAAATKLDDSPQLYSTRGIQEAEFKCVTGERAAAATQTRVNRDICQQEHWTADQAMCDTLLGLLALPDDPAAARQRLETARNYASRSGNVEIQLRCYHLATEIARTVRSFDQARSEAEAGIHLADTCGFGHYSIELRLALARVHLDAGDPKAALQRAREALDRASHPDCQYARGEADGLHLCGIAHAGLGEPELARQRLSAALVKRQQLTHPGLADTQAELARLGK
jgi:tetratricopeptide (TPR) repeat protein